MQKYNGDSFSLGVNTLFHVPGDVGGTEVYLLELLRALRLGYPQLYIVLFTSFSNHAFMQERFGSDDRISIIRVPVNASQRPKRILAEQVLLPFYVVRSGVDLLWSPGYTTPYWAGCPQVVTVHDLQYKTHPEDLTRLQRVTLDILVKTACSRCRKVIAVSEFSKSEIVKHNFADQNKVHAVLEGADQFSDSATDKSAAIDELSGKVPFDKPYLLCVAHVYPHKNVDLLVKAFARIQAVVPHNLVLIGKPRLGEPALSKALEEVTEPQRVIRFTEGVSFDLLKLLYEKADLFVLPSSYEGFGLPVLEAMISGIPVVCVKQASIPEVAGGHGFYVEQAKPELLADAILQVTQLEPEERILRIDEAKKWAESFTWQKAAEKTFALFRDTAVVHQQR